MSIIIARIAYLANIDSLSSPYSAVVMAFVYLLLLVACYCGILITWLSCGGRISWSKLLCGELLWLCLLLGSL